MWKQSLKKSWSGPPPPCVSDVAFGKKCDGGAIIELLAANQLNFSQHQISTYVRQAPNKGNEVARLRITAKSAFSLSFHLSVPFCWATGLVTGSSWGPGKVSI